jgi:dienelactone hydrolase
MSHSIAITGVPAGASGKKRAKARYSVSLLAGLKTMTAAGLMMLGVAPAMAEIHTENVLYRQGDQVMEGYLAYDSTLNNRPGVVIVHDWMGLGDDSKARARQMAALGYVAFAADIYGKRVRPKDSKEAAQMAGAFYKDRPLLRERVRAAFDTLAAQKNVNPAKMLAMGYCFGGATVLELARSGAPVIGVVTFHGGLSNPYPEDAKNIKGKVLVLHGAIDPNVKPEEVAQFQKEMNEAKVDYQFHTYPNTVHSFTIKSAGDDISKGAAYNALSDKRSFAAMKAFFEEVTE